MSTVARAHRGLAFFFLAIGVIAFFLAGLGAFGEGFDAHRVSGSLLLLLSLVLLVLAAIGRKEAVKQSAALFALMIVQMLLAVAGALHLHHSAIDADAAAALPDGLVVVYCWGPGCNGAQRGGARLAAHGRQVKEMLGGFEYYEREGWPVEVAEEAAAAPGTVRA